MSRICLEESKLTGAKTIPECALTVQQCGHSNTGAQEHSLIQVSLLIQAELKPSPSQVGLAGTRMLWPFLFFFSAHKKKMALPPHTHHGSLRPNVLSWMRPTDLNLFELRKTLFHWSHCLIFWLVLLLWLFFYTHQSCLDNHTMETKLSILTCTSLAAQTGLTWRCCGLTLLCVPLSPTGRCMLSLLLCLNWFSCEWLCEVVLGIDPART